MLSLIGSSGLAEPPTNLVLVIPTQCSKLELLVVVVVALAEVIIWTGTSSTLFHSGCLATHWLSARYVREGVQIGSFLEGSIERCTVVGGFLVLEEGCETVLGHHQQVVWYFEGFTLIVIVNTLEADFGGHDGIVVVAVVDVVDG